MPIANAIKGAKHTGQSVTWLRDDGTPPALTGSTITAKIINLANKKAITGATNASPISVTVASHGYSTGNVVRIRDVKGNTAANANWTITVVDTNTFTLDTSTGNGTYGGGGEVVLVVSSDGTFTLATTSAVNISGATNAQPIEITAAGHGFLTGQAVTIASVGGNLGANGTWIITVTGVNTFTLNNSIGTGAYTSGGTATGKVNVFTWAYSTADVATAGTYEVTFKADFGGSGYDLTYTQTWIVQDTT